MPASEGRDNICALGVVAYRVQRQAFHCNNGKRPICGKLPAGDWRAHGEAQREPALAVRGAARARAPGVGAPALLSPGPTLAEAPVEMEEEDA